MNITQEFLRIKNAYIQHGRITNPTEQVCNPAEQAEQAEQATAEQATAEQEFFTNQLVLRSHDIGLN